MRLHSLFISNSKPKKPIYESIKVAIWFIICLILLDISLNFLFPYPANVLDQPSTLSSYFDYGRSIEGKVKRQVRATDETSAPLSLAGWLKSPEIQDLPTSPASEQDLLVASYGMSFSGQVSFAMKEIDPSITLRLVNGPTAPPNYAFAAYSLDRNRHKADIVILGILAGSVEALDSITAMNWNPEVPPPYTFPKYYLKEGKLQAIWPEIQSLEELRIALKDQGKWQSFVKQMQTHDRFFNLFIFKQNILDNSVLVRLIRRALAQKYLNGVSQQIHNSKGFDPNWKQIPVLELIVQEFATTAKADGRLPIVLLLHNKGYDDHLFQLLKSTLEKNSIPYVSTHNIVPATDFKNFISDGHFTNEANQKIAKVVLKIVNKHLKKN